VELILTVEQALDEPEAQARDFLYVLKLLWIGTDNVPWFETAVKEQIDQTLFTLVGKDVYEHFPDFTLF